MNRSVDRDYVLGTHDEELERLGVQHRAWRPVVLECWEKAGITSGSRVLDVGAGPGYATLDLAGIVGPSGRVVAIERSHKFVSAIEQMIGSKSLHNIEVHEADLITDPLPFGPFDFSWCRWVLCFVSDPELLIKKLAGVMRSGGRAIFHEYGHYTTWKFFPKRDALEQFRAHVIASWRESGGEPDTALSLPSWLTKHGFRIRSAVPRIFCLRPDDLMWQWPSQFIQVHLSRLKELGRIDNEFAEKVRADLAAAENDQNSFMLTPLVLEVVADKL
jgi:ubiquinone/menaquinone biosynthesis C-methylase UbiE